MLLQLGLHGLELRKVLTHVGVEDHLDDEVAELAEVALLHVGEDVAVVLLDQSGKKERKMRALFFSIFAGMFFFPISIPGCLRGKFLSEIEEASIGRGIDKSIFALTSCVIFLCIFRIEFAIC